MEENPYQVLGVSEDATASQIKSAYRKLALRHHPDRQNDEKSKQMATQIFSKISNAYEIIGDEGRRREFDMQQQQEQQQANSFHFHPGQFHDPFQVFAQAFGEEFGTAPRSRGAFSDPFFSDPFGGGNLFGNLFGGGGRQRGGFGGLGGDPFGEDMYSSMSRQMNMMQQQHQQMQQQMQQSGGAMPGFSSSSYYSSSSSNFGGGGNRESVSTSTRIINGKRQTVTERVITKPDGTTERHVETSGDDDFPQHQLEQPGWFGGQQQRQLPPTDRSQRRGGL